METTPVEVTRDRVLAFRRRSGVLTHRLPAGTDAVRRAAWAGLQDSMPRAALLSLHARVAGVGPDALDDPELEQVWGPRFSVHVVATRDRAVFTLGRLPTDARGRERAEDLAARLRDLLDDGEELGYGHAGRALDVHPNALRYAAATGTVVLRWHGALQPTIRVVDPPRVEPQDARHELARRHLHVVGPSTPEAFARWAGVATRQARVTFDELRDELAAVRTAVGDGWVLAADLPSLRVGPPADPVGATDDGEVGGESVRLLPSGDPYWLLWGQARELLLEEPDLRDRLWTPRVWPGAVLVGGEVVGTWRRAGADLDVDPWRAFTEAERAAVESEATSLPLPGLDRPIVVTWTS
ncbi:DNA glycosylase AlkZ-like family protein [Salsipaludibacter albus]|uniref:DNA glycosylase AlkZ-like family protein n=1 Tax=Salsipaludibacter albus TaxID=2849650 RepID=UPI001EE41BD1|nr:crosslink repair DNA glycosylase YcaQ family protein [Salsipaludibacter albus]MBY5162310.1 winged helix DNA-binding domain-containing protein [Salsipaludibacter albus]